MPREGSGKDRPDILKYEHVQLTAHQKFFELTDDISKAILNKSDF